MEKKMTTPVEVLCKTLPSIFKYHPFSWILNLFELLSIIKIWR